MISETFGRYQQAVMQYCRWTNLLLINAILACLRQGGTQKMVLERVMLVAFDFSNLSNPCILLGRLRLSIHSHSG